MNTDNNHFSELVTRLPQCSRKLFIDQLQIETGLNMKNRFTNWQQGKSRIPPYLRTSINKVAALVIVDLVNSYLADFDENIILNIFPMESTAKTNIKAERALRNMTQLDLSKAVGLTVTTITNIETKKVGVSLRNATAIAKFFGKKVEDFIDFEC